MRIFQVRKEIKNILTLLKLRIRGVQPKKYLESKLFNAEESLKMDMDSFINQFDKTIFNKPLQAAHSHFKESGNYYCFEKQLWRTYLEFVSNDDLRYPIGPYPIISYLSKKEIEQKNLLIIAKGIISELTADEIKEMLI